MTEEIMIDWLEVKLRRAPGQCRDEAERKMGMNEVKLTLARIRYLRDMEAQIKQHLQMWFSETEGV